MGIECNSRKLLVLGVDSLEVGMHQEAIEDLQVAAYLSQEHIGWPGYGYARTGRREEAIEVLGPLGAGGMGEVYRAYDERDFPLLFLKVEPTYDGLRDGPRFDDLMRRVGFPAD